MSNVVSFTNRKPVEVFNGRLVTQPTSKIEYMFLCKETLAVEDYEEFLLSILDEDYYRVADDQIKAIVNEYYSFDK